MSHDDSAETETQYPEYVPPPGGWLVASFLCRTCVARWSEMILQCNLNAPAHCPECKQHAGVVIASYEDLE